MNNEPYEFFLIRRAATPISALLQLHLQSGADFDKWETLLLALFRQSDFSDAIYIASPSLHAALTQYSFHSPENTRRKILFSLYKYLIRITTRATPFGLFSATGAGKLSGQTNLTSVKASNITKSIRFQPEVLSHIARYLQEQINGDRHTLYRVNSSLYPSRNGYRYIERASAGAHAVENLIEVTYSAHLSLLIQASKQWKSKVELTELMACSIGLGEAVMFIEEAVDAGILVSELNYNITGPDFQDRLKAYLDQHQYRSTAIKQLWSMLNDLSPHTSASELDRAARQISALVPNSISASFFRAQLTMKAASFSLQKKAVERLAKEFSAIKGLLRRNSLHPSYFDELKNNFKTVHGQRQVPLTELMDSPMGTQYAQISIQGSMTPSLLEQLEFTFTETQQLPGASPAGKLKQQLLDRALRSGTDRIEINDYDLREISKEAPCEHGTYWLGELIASNQQELDAGHFAFYLKASGGQSGLELMARCAQDDPALTAYLTSAAHFIASENAKAIHAEIAHIPNDRAAAVLARPRLWPYEIPYLAHSTLKEANQISINDILVSLSKEGKFVLTSIRLGKQIIVHNTSAHNYHQGLPVYRFLSQVANQDIELLRWDWEHLEDFSFLPMISYRHLILTPAKWTVCAVLRERILNAIGCQVKWSALKQQLQIPRYFQAGHGDNLLLFDSENRFSMELFAIQLQKQSISQIQQYLPDVSGSINADLMGGFAHELVLAFKPAAKVSQEASPLLLPDLADTRLFHLGSQWLYLQIYAECALLDTILLNRIAPACKTLTEQGMIRKWYFLRFFEPTSHIRLRVLLTNKEDWQIALGRLHLALTSQIDSSRIEQIQTATYERELERYASLGYESVESIFYYDSLACIEIISELQHQAQDTARLQAALIGIDALLDDFQMGIDQKLTFTSNAYLQFMQELSQDKTFTRQLDRKYRKIRPVIDQALANPSELCIKVSDHFKIRSEKIRELLAASLSLPEIASYVHMFINRILESAHRKQEMILLYFLSKQYRSTKTIGHFR